MTDLPARALPATLLTALLCLLLGGTALSMGHTESSAALWGFGVACLLEVPPSLSLRGRLRDGLGNRGLERDRVTLRTVSVLQRCLALGMGLAAAVALVETGSTQTRPGPLALAGLAVGLVGPLWLAKRGRQDTHPTLVQDALRTRTLLELAGLLLAACLLRRWFPWADGALALAMALRLFLAGQTLVRATTVPAAACGGCGGGCGG